MHHEKIISSLLAFPTQPSRLHISSFPSHTKPRIDTTILASSQLTHNSLQTVAIEFPFTAEDKESNSSSGGDGKTKSSGTASNSVSSKTVNSIFGEADKANSSSKASSPTATAATPIIDQTSSIDCELAKTSPKANNCDASDVISNAIDTSGIKQEIKDDPDAPKVNKSVNNHQPAPGGSLLPPHAANAKNPVSTPHCFVYFHALVNSKMVQSC